jgi:hypothetical protein
MKRLRSAGLPAQLVALFFIPFLNLLFFLVLCLLPEADGAPAEAKATPPRDSRLARLSPASALGSAAISLLLTVPLGFGAALLGAQVLTNYGWGLFVALPFALGFASAVIYRMRQPRSLASWMWVAGLSTMLLGPALLALAFEGVICLLMAAPLVLPLAAFGGACAYLVQRRRRFDTEAPALLSILLVFAPGVEWAEHCRVGPGNYAPSLPQIRT